MSKASDRCCAPEAEALAWWQAEVPKRSADRRLAGDLFSQARKAFEDTWNKLKPEFEKLDKQMQFVKNIMNDIVRQIGESGYRQRPVANMIPQLSGDRVTYEQMDEAFDQYKALLEKYQQKKQELRDQLAKARSLVDETHKKAQDARDAESVALRGWDKAQEASVRCINDIEKNYEQWVKDHCYSKEGDPCFVPGNLRVLIRYEKDLTNPKAPPRAICTNARRHEQCCKDTPGQGPEHPGVQLDRNESDSSNDSSRVEPTLESTYTETSTASAGTQNTGFNFGIPTIVDLGSQTTSSTFTGGMPNVSAAGFFGNSLPFSPDSTGIVGAPTFENRIVIGGSGILLTQNSPFASTIPNQDIGEDELGQVVI